MVSCELVLCVKELIHPSLRSCETQSCMCFSLATRKLLELLEAPFNNIRVVSGVLGVLKGTQEVFGIVFCCFLLV